VHVVGDWYNKLDWSCESNNFGVGLAPGSKNSAAWPLHKPRLVSQLQPSTNLIKLCRHAILNSDATALATLEEEEDFRSKP